MFALDYWVGPCGTTYGTDAIACQLYYNTANLKKKKKTPSKRTREEKKKGLNSKQKTTPENAKFVAAEKSMREST
jgi:hypothetical protein